MRILNRRKKMPKIPNTNGTTRRNKLNAIINNIKKQ